MKVLGYAKVKILLKDGAYEDFAQLADDIGRANLAKDLHMNIQTLRRRTNDPGLWNIHELAALADLLGMPHSYFADMADRLRVVKKKGKK
jgi:hypothetical protein